MLILWSPCQIFSDSLLSDCFLWSLLLLPVSSEIEMFSPGSHNSFQDWINPGSQPKLIEALISPWQQCKASSIYLCLCALYVQVCQFSRKMQTNNLSCLFWPKGFNDARDENCSYLQAESSRCVLWGLVTPIEKPYWWNHLCWHAFSFRVSPTYRPLLNSHSQIFVFRRHC